MSWVEGGRMTQAANASLMINIITVVMPFFVWITYRERSIKYVLGEERIYDFEE